jgi:hypothetical protein
VLLFERLMPPSALRQELFRMTTKTVTTLALAAVATLGLSAAPAQARPHRHKVCHVVHDHHHAHRVCNWVG